MKLVAFLREQARRLRAGAHRVHRDPGGRARYAADHRTRLAHASRKCSRRGSPTPWPSPTRGRKMRIPYRSLVPRDVDGLLFAGRCLSAEADAMVQLRLIPVCFATRSGGGHRGRARRAQRGVDRATSMWPRSSANCSGRAWSSACRARSPVASPRKWWAAGASRPPGAGRRRQATAGERLPVSESRLTRTTTVLARVSGTNSQSRRPEYLPMIACIPCSRSSSAVTTVAVPKPITDS